MLTKESERNFVYILRKKSAFYLGEYRVIIRARKRHDNSLC